VSSPAAALARGFAARLPRTALWLRLVMMVPSAPFCHAVVCGGG
jgi:hypothetical protein